MVVEGWYCSGSVVKLGQDRIHFSCVWFLSEVAVRAVIFCDPSVPSNQHPTQPWLFHTLYIKAAAALHQLNMANKDRQSSLSFPQSAAGGMKDADVFSFCFFNFTFSHLWFVGHLHTSILHFRRLFSDFCTHTSISFCFLYRDIIFPLCCIAVTVPIRRLHFWPIRALKCERR